MSASLLRPSRVALLWMAAAAVLVHAGLRRFEPDGALAMAALWGFLLGALPLLAGSWGRGRREVVLEPVLGGLLTAIAAVVGVLLLDALDAGPLLHALLLAALAAAGLAGGGALARVSRLVGVEWLKLRRGRLLRAGLLVSAAATLIAGLGHVPIENESGWTEAAQCLGVGFWTAEILVLVLGATAIAGEISQDTMKMILPHAYDRADWVAAKAVVLLLAGLLFAAVVVVVGVGYTAIDMGLGDVTRLAAGGFGEEETLQVFQTAEVMRRRLLETAVAAAASLATSALVGLFLSCLFHTLVPALSASFLVFAALKAGEIFLGLSPEALAGIYAHYPDALRGLTENFGRALNERWDETLLPDGLHLCLLTGTLCLLAAMRIFGRRDLNG